MSGLSGPTSQFLNGTHEFSELVLARMALLMDQSRSVLPLRSAKAREFGELWRENVRARLGPFHLNWPELVLSAGQNGPMESRLKQCSYLIIFQTQGTFSTSDLDNENQAVERQKFTYILMSSAGLPFVIDGDALNTTRTLDYETTPSWNITVKSQDSGNPPLSIMSTFQITVAGW